MKQIDNGEEKRGMAHERAPVLLPYTYLQTVLKESQKCSGNPVATVDLATQQ